MQPSFLVGLFGLIIFAHIFAHQESAAERQAKLQAAAAKMLNEMAAAKLAARVKRMKPLVYNCPCNSPLPCSTSDPFEERHPRAPALSWWQDIHYCDQYIGSEAYYLCFYQVLKMATGMPPYSGLLDILKFLLTPAEEEPLQPFVQEFELKSCSLL